MSMVYHSYNSSKAVNELVAGAYAEHAGTLGFDESLSTLSRNAVENRVIANRILQDEADYLLKTEAKTKYAVEYVNTTPSTIQDKIYSVNGGFYAGDAANSTLHELGKVKTVNSQRPDSNGNVAIEADDIPTSTTGVSVQDALNLAATKSYVQRLYPVGTIYMNDVANSVPFDFGTWQLIDGKFLYGCASNFRGIGTSGGASSVTLALANLPSDSISITIPSLTGTAAETSTKHTHSGTTDANNRGHTHGVTVNGNSIGGMKAVQVADGLNLATVQFYGGTGTGYSHAHSASAGGESQDHTHTFTTGDMSKNEKHSHTVTTDSSSTSVRLGSGTAFSIIPPYHKCAIWHRVA